MLILPSVCTVRPYDFIDVAESTKYMEKTHFEIFNVLIMDFILSVYVVCHFSMECVGESNEHEYI